MPDRSCANRFCRGSARFVSALTAALLVPAASGAAAPPQSSPPEARSRATPSTAGSPASDALIRTVREFTNAQRAFDSARLAELTTPDYLEISPAGELDSREKMLGFYAPDKKIAAPELAFSDMTVRTFGDCAVLIAKIAFTLQPPGQPARTVEMRASFVARRMSGNWKIASTQYTGIRPSAR